MKEPSAADRIEAARNKVLIQQRVLAAMLPDDPGWPMALRVLEEMEKNLCLVETAYSLDCLDQGPLARG